MPVLVYLQVIMLAVLNSMSFMPFNHYIISMSPATHPAVHRLVQRTLSSMSSRPMRHWQTTAGAGSMMHSIAPAGSTSSRMLTWIQRNSRAGVALQTPLQCTGQDEELP